MLPISENGYPKDLEFVGEPIVVTEGKGILIIIYSPALVIFQCDFFRIRLKNSTSYAEKLCSLFLDTALLTQFCQTYSKIPILRPPLGLSKSGLKDHFWTVPKVVSNQRYTGCRK